jgi:mannose-6-phosphate isomerase
VTAETTLYPLLLEPSLHVKVWGGRKLQTVMGKALPTDEPYGEAWELHDTATVANGPLAGQTLGAVLAQYGVELIGAGNDPAQGLPLLVKIIDAADWLSIQVHPDDAQAAELEGQPRGKTEAWFILAADPGAKLVIGVQPGTNREAMAQAIRDQRLEDLLVTADVGPGDALYIPAGTVHALGPGIMLYEIQQSSNTTYRLYDWGRLGLDGQPRPLHIEKGVAVSNVESLPPITHPGADGSPEVMVAQGEFFTTKLHHLAEADHVTIESGGRFHALTCIAGAVEIAAGGLVTPLHAGRTALIPAGVEVFTLHGSGQVLRSWQGDA